MSTRRAVLNTIGELAFAAELLDDPRARAWGGAAWALRSVEGDIAELRESGALAEVRGVGAATLAVIDDVLAGREPEAVALLTKQVPEGLFVIRRIKGLGPKKVKQLWKELDITTLGELEYACRENRLLDLKGFGSKTQAKVQTEIARLRSTEGARRRDQAAEILEPLARALRGLETVGRVAIVGDHARGEELVRDVGVLAEASDGATARALFEEEAPNDVTLHIASKDAFAAQHVWLTSSLGHQSALSARAAEEGLAFDAAGLSDETGAAIDCDSEEAVYEALGLSPTARERRDDHVPLVGRGKARPRLLSRRDLRGALHNHTTASDGTASLEQMRAAAAARGLSYLGINEHSETAFYARGLDASRLRAQLETIRALNEAAGDCVLLSGVESDILGDGALDYDADLLGALEIVVASAHKRFAPDRDRATARMVEAARNAFTDIIGHPTGRLLLGRAPTDFDMAALLDVCAERSVAVELNANPHRLDLSAEHLAMAKERGILVSIAADAHATGELDHLEHGVTIARRAGLTAEDVLNTRTLGELRAWISARRP